MFYIIIYCNLPLQDAEEGLTFLPSSCEIIGIIYESRPPTRGNRIEQEIKIHAKRSGWLDFDWQLRNTGHRQWSTIEIGGVGSYKVFAFDHMDGR